MSRRLRLERPGQQKRPALFPANSAGTDRAVKGRGCGECGRARAQECPSTPLRTSLCHRVFSQIQNRRDGPPGALLRAADGGAVNSQPRRAPKTRLNPNVSQKWVRATLGGIKGLGSSSVVVEADKKSAVAVADSHRATRSMRT